MFFLTRIASMKLVCYDFTPIIYELYNDNLDRSPNALALALALRLQFLARQCLPLQKLGLLGAALAQIQEQHQQRRAQQAQAEEEVERRAIIAVRAGVDDGRGDQRAYERGCLADDGEEGEEEEFFPARGHF